MTRNIDIAFDFGFDWNVPASLAYRDSVYPLQLGLSSLNGNCVGGLCNGNDIRFNQAACCRVFDFSEPTTEVKPVPLALQVLFSSGTSGDQGTCFSPIKDQKGSQLPQLVLMDFEVLNSNNSPVYGNCRNGWQANFRGATGPATYSVMENGGRFLLRAMLTVGIPGQPARYYRIDPEMVVGGGPN